MVRTKEQIVAEETSKFMDTQFGQLDLSGSPDLNNLPAEDKFELQDRYGFNRVDESGLAGINQLKELLTNPPRDVVEEIAKETQNPELMSELANERAEDVANEFRRRNPGYLKCDANWRSIVETLAHNCLGEDDLEAEEAQDLLMAHGHWTLKNLTAAYKSLDRVGALEYPPNHSRPLKEAQRLRAEQLSANGDVLGGIVEYLKGGSQRWQGTKWHSLWKTHSPLSPIPRCGRFSKKRASFAGKRTARIIRRHLIDARSSMITVPGAS